MPPECLRQPLYRVAALILLEPDDVGARDGEEAHLLFVVVIDLGAAVPHVKGENLELFDELGSGGAHRNCEVRDVLPVNIRRGDREIGVCGVGAGSAQRIPSVVIESHSGLPEPS